MDLTACDMLFYAEKPYLIVYRAEADRVVVLRVLHAARDVSALLSDG